MHKELPGAGPRRRRDHRKGLAMAAPATLMSDLEQAIRRGSAARRASAVEQIAALFAAGAEQLSEPQVAVFDAVFCRLVTEIEARALVELAATLAPIGNAPVKLVRRLAGADDIAVAGPLLARSARLAEADLMAIARTQSQAHLLAIAGRPQLQAPLTDLLVRRGDDAVVHGLADNPGARFSSATYAVLVRRAGADPALAERIGRRGDLTARLFRRLVLQATAVVQERLIANAAPALQADIRGILTRVAADVGTARRRDYRAARPRVAALRRRGELSEAKLIAFAAAGAFEDTALALSALGGVPLRLVDRLLTAARPDPILILCKALGYGWPTAAAVLSLRFMAGSPSLALAMQQFERLPAATSVRVMQFWRAHFAARGPALPPPAAGQLPAAGRLGA